MVEELSRQTSTDALVSHFKSVFKIPDSKQCRLYFKSKDSNVKLHSGNYIKDQNEIIF
jgi:hypothetical protein